VLLLKEKKKKNVYREKLLAEAEAREVDAEGNTVCDC
jgi:hypothetical protein